MSCVKDYEEHSLVQTSFAELPNINIFYYTRRILMQLSKCEKNLEWAAQAPGPPGLWVRCKVTAGEKWDPHKKKPHQNSDDRKSAPAPGSELALVSYIWSAYVGGFFSRFSAFSFSFLFSSQNIQEPAFQVLHPFHNLPPPHHPQPWTRMASMDASDAPALKLKCYFTSTETAGLLGTGAQDGQLDSHTAPGLWDTTVQCCFTSTETIRLIRDGSPGRPPRLSHSSWA